LFAIAFYIDLSVFRKINFIIDFCSGESGKARAQHTREAGISYATQISHLVTPSNNCKNKFIWFGIFLER
jgi:hypothetical protein